MAQANQNAQQNQQQATPAQQQAQGAAGDLAKKAEKYGIPVRTIAEAKIPHEILKYIPEDSAKHYGMIPLGVADGVLEVGIVDPDNLEARDALQFISSKANLPYKLFLISQADFEKGLESYSGLSGEVTKALSELEGEISAEEKSKAAGKKEGKVDIDSGGTKIIEDAPVTKIVATILRYAIEGRASDIHIEPTRDNIRVRFRVDGVLHTSLVLPSKVHDAVVARIKVLANMKLDEKRKPQDNRFSAHIDKRRIDFRVSTFPTYYGEKVVMRILDPEKGVRSLEETGLPKKYLDMVRRALQKPYGMVLISGPTGSGKTTTLYGMLAEVDKETKNVLSLEDPVEYSISGMSQSQVRPEIGYTFANGLRTTLRQDPDVIMVGEIRDKETAALAIQAALTGHLVLSTIHTNNVVGIIPRLVEMGIDPYLIAPTLILGMAQRLVKTLCPNTGKQIPVEGDLKQRIEQQFADLPEEYRSQLNLGQYVYEAQPTDECPTGTKGRVGVFEAFEMTPSMEKVVLENPTNVAVMKEARRAGMITLKEDALLKSFQGIVPFGEVNMLGGLYEEGGVDVTADAQEAAEAAGKQPPESEQKASEEKTEETPEK